jgi:membrane associated rhomboid family serine protease
MSKNERGVVSGRAPGAARLVTRTMTAFFVVPEEQPAQTATRTLLTICIVVLCSLTYISTVVAERVMHLPIGKLTHFVAGLVPIWLLGDSARPPELDLVPLWLTPLTAIFVHQGVLHLVLNMLWFWAFGRELERILGLLRYATLLIVAAYATAYFQALAARTGVPVIGASGVVAAVLGGYVILRPKSVVRVWFFPIGSVLPMPAIFPLAGWFILDLLRTFDVVSKGRDDLIAHPAHLSGFLVGIGLAALLRPSGMPLFDQGKPWPRLDWHLVNRESNPRTERWARLFDRATRIMAITVLVGLFSLLVISYLVLGLKIW